MKPALAEFTGVYMLVLAAAGAGAVEAATGALGHIGSALASGLVVMVMIAAVGHLSGAHLNPAVTLGFALTRHFAWRAVPAYVAAQLAGGVAAAVTLRLLLGPGGGLGAHQPTLAVGPALGVEILITATLMFVIVAVATDTRAVGEMAAVSIGAAVALNILWAGPLTGGSMNPARSFGPALLTGAWDAHWIYWAGPLLGAALGAFLYQWLRAAENGAGAAAPEQTPPPANL
jgi:MIP family channel proteins